LISSASIDPDCSACKPPIQINIFKLDNLTALIHMNLFFFYTALKTFSSEIPHPPKSERKQSKM
jgi:hypothetical protein